MHNHEFKNTGGGCFLPTSPSYDISKSCDDNYECTCGEKFTVYTSPTGHRYLPEFFKTEPMSEKKSIEQQLIDDAIIKSELTP